MKVSVAVATFLYFLRTEASPAPRTYYDGNRQDGDSQVVGVPIFVIVVPRQEEAQPRSHNVKNYVRYADPENRDDYGVSVDYLGLDLGRQLKIEDLGRDMKIDDGSQLPILRIRGACTDFRKDCLRYCQADRSCQGNHNDCEPVCQKECSKMIPCEGA